MALVAFLLRHWRAVLVVSVLAGLVGALVLTAMRLEQQKATTASVHASLVRAKGAFDLTVASYRTAAVTAARRDAENVARVQARQAAITERAVDDYQARLADSSAAYERLRARSAAYSRSTPAADLSAAGDAACRAYAATSCDALPALLKAAQDNTDQLVALIAWSTAQGEVDVAGEVTP